MNATGKEKSMIIIEYRDEESSEIKQLECYQSFGIWKFKDNDYPIRDMPIDAAEEIIRSELSPQELKTLATIKLMEKQDV